jgi:hypothetical protein
VLFQRRGDATDDSRAADELSVAATELIRATADAISRLPFRLSRTALDDTLVANELTGATADANRDSDDPRRTAAEDMTLLSASASAAWLLIWIAIKLTPMAAKLNLARALAIDLSECIGTSTETYIHLYQ